MTKNAYNWVLSDWFHPTAIQRIERAEGSVLEAGKASRVDASWWGPGTTPPYSGGAYRNGFHITGNRVFRYASYKMGRILLFARLNFLYNISTPLGNTGF